jgi:hypothetical protein
MLVTMIGTILAAPYQQGQASTPGAGDSSQVGITHGTGPDSQPVLIGPVHAPPPWQIFGPYTPPPGAPAASSYLAAVHFDKVRSVDRA